MSRPIRIIDKRNKQYFVVDDVYLNGYAKHLGPITSMVYISLCRHVDKDQTAFPSQEKIAEEIGAGLRSVENSIAVLKKWNLIEVQRDKTERKWARNLYYLLDKNVWKKPSPAPNAVDPSPANDDIDHPHQVLTKDTHIIKDTHTLISNDIKGEFGNSQVNKGIELLTSFFGYRPSREKQNRYTLSRLFKSKGEERTLKAMKFALSQQINRYAPKITSYMDLEQKWSDLEVYARRELTTSKKGGVIDATNI